MRPIYLDNNATTQLDPEVLEAMRPYLADVFGNPSSRHSAGRAARQAIDRSMQQIAAALDAQPEQILFTSGATEANNLAIASIPDGAHVLVSPADHPSALDAAERLTRRGCEITRLRLTAEGYVSSLSAELRDDTRLVVVQLANSETGCIQPVAELAQQLPEQCRFHCDATQAVGKIPVRFGQLGVTSLSCSGHKLHGPAGVGVLIVRDPEMLRPMMFGGHQQRGLRPGTESVAAIVGMGKAIEIATTRLEEHSQHLGRLRDRFEQLVAERIDSVAFNRCEHRLPNTSNISFLGAKAEALLIALDLSGVCCSAGTACSSGSLEPSAVLRAMGIEGQRLEGALRFSFGRFNTDEDVDRAVDALVRVCQKVRASIRV